MFNDSHSDRLCLILIMSVMHVDSCSSLLRLHQNAYSYDGDHIQLDLLQKHGDTSLTSWTLSLQHFPVHLVSQTPSIIPEQYQIFYRNLNYNAAIADAGNE